MEMWKDVVGYQGIYEVSNLGEVRTHEDKTSFSKRHGVDRKWKQRVLKQKVSKDKNCRVSLWKDGKEQTWLVHRLVAYAFLPKPEGKEYINHIDGNRLNNHVDNLEWCDHKENNNHAFDNRLIKTGQELVLLNRETKEMHYFRSQTKASAFLGKYHGFISAQLKKGQNEYNEYVFFTQA
ncbi:NUMOD4 motif-containing HNH endonuclease [Metabacillus dongyingensis]|uniref:NUMOD4 motif-containing HNH endonuclease n=1 Tax=Metabacillus dongyingensis TaxID=2874282 RepID=UPI003B8E11B3